MQAEHGSIQDSEPADEEEELLPHGAQESLLLGQYGKHKLDDFSWAED